MDVGFKSVTGVPEICSHLCETMLPSKSDIFPESVTVREAEVTISPSVVITGATLGVFGVGSVVSLSPPPPHAANKSGANSSVTFFRVVI